MIGMESNGSEHITMKISEKLIDMTAYNDRELRTFLENNEFSQITVYLKDSKNRKEKIMTNEGTRLIDDDWDNFSFSDRFLEWMCVIAEK